MVQQIKITATIGRTCRLHYEYDIFQRDNEYIEIYFKKLELVSVFSRRQPKKHRYDNKNLVKYLMLFI